MAYNLTAFVNESRTLPDVITNINDASGGFFVLGTLLLVFIIAFISLKFFETRVAMLVSSMITTLLSIYAWSAGWVGFGFVFIPVILMFISLIWSALGE